jgi:hypothetical protein
MLYYHAPLSNSFVTSIINGKIARMRANEMIKSIENTQKQPIFRLQQFSHNASVKH